MAGTQSTASRGCTGLPAIATAPTPVRWSDSTRPSRPSESCWSQRQATDIYLTALAILLTVVYLLGLLFRPKRRIARMGTDSLMVLVLYGLGIAGLFVVASA